MVVREASEQRLRIDVKIEVFRERPKKISKTTNGPPQIGRVAAGARCSSRREV
jgi:hypothetical protein